MFGTYIYKGPSSNIRIINLGFLDIPSTISDEFKIKCLYSEPMFIVMGHYDNGNSLEIMVKETDYESFVNLKEQNYNVRGFSVQGFVRHGEDLLLEQRADWLDFSPNKVGLCGGIVNSINLEYEFLREAREEIGVDDTYLQDDLCIAMPEDGLGFFCILFLNAVCNVPPPYKGSDEGNIMCVPENGFAEYSNNNVETLAPPLVGALAALGKVVSSNG